jgi:hypothetical protein
VYMGVCMMAWSAVAAATAGVQNYIGLVLVRFFLGKLFPQSFLLL